jgi:hypothetical protein
MYIRIASSYSFQVQVAGLHGTGQGACLKDAVLAQIIGTFLVELVFEGKGEQSLF